MSILALLAFHTIFVYGLIYFWNIYIYNFSFNKTYIYLEACLVFDKNRIFWVLMISFCLRNLFVFIWASMPYFHDFIDYMIFCTLYISFVYSWFWFMSLYELYQFLSVDSHKVFIYYRIYICFIPYLKDFVLIFKIIIKIVSLFFNLVVFFNLC